MARLEREASQRLGVRVRVRLRPGHRWTAHLDRRALVVLGEGYSPARAIDAMEAHLAAHGLI